MPYYNWRCVEQQYPPPDLGFQYYDSSSIPQIQSPQIVPLPSNVQGNKDISMNSRKIFQPIRTVQQVKNPDKRRRQKSRRLRRNERQNRNISGKRVEETYRGDEASHEARRNKSRLRPVIKRENIWRDIPVSEQSLFSHKGIESEVLNLDDNEMKNTTVLVQRSPILRRSHTTTECEQTAASDAISLERLANLLSQRKEAIFDKDSCTPISEKVRKFKLNPNAEPFYPTNPTDVGYMTVPETYPMQQFW